MIARELVTPEQYAVADKATRELDAALRLMRASNGCDMALINRTQTLLCSARKACSAAGVSCWAERS